MRNRLWTASLATLAVTLSVPALAQKVDPAPTDPAPTSRTTSYDAAFFAAAGVAQAAEQR